MKQKESKNKNSDKINAFITKYKVINVLFACIAYIYICLEQSIIPYDLNSWMIFFILIIAFINTKFNVKYEKPIIFFSLLFSFISVFGAIVYKFQNITDVNIFEEIFHFKYLLYFAGSFSLIFIILCHVIPGIFKILKLDKIDLNYMPSKYVFFLCFLLIYIAWLPYFTSYYPGLLTPDSIVNIEIMNIKGYQLSNHHPIVHSMFMVMLMKAGIKLFGTLTAGVATAIIIQMIIMAAIFSYTITYCYKLGANKFLLIMMLIIYAFVPVFGFYSITMWKDIMFGGFMLLLTIQSFKLFRLDKDSALSKKNLISFIMISLLCLFFRNNAIYMYFIYIIVLLLLYKEHRKMLLGSFAIILGVYFFVQGPVFNHFDVKKTESSEYIGMPLQMVGRMAFKGVEFTKSEEKLINKLIPVDVLAHVYNPMTSDGIKFSNDYNEKVFNKNKWEYFKLWASLVAKHPKIALEAYANSTLGYWYPGVKFWAAMTYTYGNSSNPKGDFGLDNYAVSDRIKQATIYLEKRETPIANMEWSIGLCFWAISILLYSTIVKHGYKVASLFVPVMGIWLTLMIASPVFGEYRYVFSAFTCLPFFITINFLDIKKLEPIKEKK